jgi:hypothetical protein
MNIYIIHTMRDTEPCIFTTNGTEASTELRYALEEYTGERGSVNALLAAAETEENRSHRSAPYIETVPLKVFLGCAQRAALEEGSPLMDYIADVAVPWQTR